MFELNTPFDAAQDNAHEAANKADLAALDALVTPAAAPPVAPPVAGPNPGFQFPPGLWRMMIACYAVFFAAMLVATGGSGSARFVIAISAMFAVIYFGLARIMSRQAGPEDPSPVSRGQLLPTWTGPVDARSVYAQVLIVPGLIAFFGAAIVIIIASLT